MYHVHIHIKTKPSKGKLHVNEGGIYVGYSSRDDWGTITRTLTHKGVDHRFVAGRLCSEEEYKTEASAWRIHFSCYQNWDLLIEDEKMFTDHPEWFAKLDQLKIQFPQFMKKSINQKAKSTQHILEL